MCQIAPMQRAIVKAIGAFAALVTASAEAVAQRNGSDWDLPARGIDQQPGGGGPGASASKRNDTLDALDKIRRNLIGANAVYPTPFGARRAANVLGERPERARPAALPEQVAAELVFFTT